MSVKLFSYALSFNEISTNGGLLVAYFGGLMAYNGYGLFTGKV